MAQLIISLCVLSICLASVLTKDSSVQFASQSLSTSTVRSVCKPIPSTLSLCHGVGYREMRLPNLLGHDSLKEAQQQSAAWLPLVSKLCHRDTKKFLCSLFAPVCLPEGPLPWAVRGCEGRLSSRDERVRVPVAQHVQLHPVPARDPSLHSHHDPRHRACAEGRGTRGDIKGFVPIIIGR